MENNKKLLVVILMIIPCFIFGILISEFATYLLSLPNTIANVLGYTTYVLTLVGMIVLGFKFLKFLNK
jgi:uncharacterized membrane protein YadS